MLKKLLIVVWFGPYPIWLNKWVANMEVLKSQGFDYLIISNKELFEKRIKDKLGLETVIEEGTGKPWDFRPALGVLFEEEIKGYDYWGHTDFDCIYGDISKFMPDEELSGLELWSNHHNYVCGPWTLYKNCEKVNNCFYLCNQWKELMLDKNGNGWVERDFTLTIERNLVYKYTMFQADKPDNLTVKDGCLYDDGKEIMMFHFRHYKYWPNV